MLWSHLDWRLELVLSYNLVEIRIWGVHVPGILQSFSEDVGQINEFPSFSAFPSYWVWRKQKNFTQHQELSLTRGLGALFCPLWDINSVSSWLGTSLKGHIGTELHLSWQLGPAFTWRGCERDLHLPSQECLLGLCWCRFMMNRWSKYSKRS